MVDQAIDGGKSKGTLVVQDAASISEDAVSGDNYGPTFMPVRNDLNKHLMPCLAAGRRTIHHDKELGDEITFFLHTRSLFLGDPTGIRKTRATI